MSTLNIALLTVGGVVLLVGLFSEPLKRSILSVPLVCLSAGVLLGPAVLGVLDPADWGNQAIILEQAARLTIAISLMGIALRLPSGYPLRRWRPLAVLLGPVMVLMWLASGLLAFLVLGVPFWAAMLIGAVITPTDPVVSSTIVQGDLAEKNLPARVRHLLSGESGANDGLAYPLVFLSILMLQHPPGEALTEWLVRVLVWEVGAAVVLGALMGYGAGKLLDLAQSRGYVTQPSYLAYTLALSLAVLGSTRLLGTDGILAVFAAGVALNVAVETANATEEERVQEAVNRFFVMPVFVLLGLALPWAEWADLGWKGLVLAALVLLLRRLPWVLASIPLIPRASGARDGLFLGWFGPIGVAALFYATLAEHQAGMHEAWVVGSLVISVSVLVHGMSAAPLTRLYGRHASATPGEGTAAGDR
ncbi:MAG: cation:proton antiporter [Actinomycetota bacterium]|nr:cation:proton antiporter [Actinomycetota bacterium]